MENFKGNRSEVEEYLLKEYKRKGFLLEDDIIDVCIENDFDVIEIDILCDKLLNRKLIVRDSIGQIEDEDDDSYVDRSHLDYEQLLNQVKKEYPNCASLITEILSILPPQSGEWQTLIGPAQNGNKFAYERLIKMYLRTVMKQAYTFSKNNYCDFEDSFQDGVIGLMNAIEKYDTTSSDRFSAYFTLWVMQSMQRHSNIRGTIVRYPVHYREQLLSIVGRACEVMEDDDFEEAVERANAEFFENNFFVRDVSKEHILPYVKISEDILVEDPCDAILNSMVKDVVKDMLLELQKKERDIIELRYGLRDGRGRTLEEVGQIYNVTRERIRQIEVKALRKLRQSRGIERLKDFW